MAHIVDNFFKKTGRSDVRRYAMTCVNFFSYCDLVVTLSLSISGCLSIVCSKENLSIAFNGFLWFIIEINLFIKILFRLCHQSKCRDLYDHSQLMEGIPENYRRAFVMMIAYFCIMPTLQVTVPLFYMISFDWAQIGDAFSFPFADVLPTETTNMTVYVCKYILYTIVVYITYLKSGFLNATFVYMTGVVKRRFQVLEEQIKEAMINKNEQKLKIMNKHHQEVLKWVVFNALYLWFISTYIFGDIYIEKYCRAKK